MLALARYFARLSAGRTVLWCYAIWYGINVANHFESQPRLWLTSVGLGLIIGTALYISTRGSRKNAAKLDRWQIIRLFLTPFCVSSFSALVKDEGYTLVFPPTWRENLTGIGLITLFVGLVTALRATSLAKP